MAALAFSEVEVVFGFCELALPDGFALGEEKPFDVDGLELFDVGDENPLDGFLLEPPENSDFLLDEPGEEKPPEEDGFLLLELDFGDENSDFLLDDPIEDEGFLLDEPLDDGLLLKELRLDPPDGLLLDELRLELPDGFEELLEGLPKPSPTNVSASEAHKTTFK